jgi:hypothetical protein
MAMFQYFAFFIVAVLTCFTPTTVFGQDFRSANTNSAPMQCRDRGAGTESLSGTLGSAASFRSDFVAYMDNPAAASRETLTLAEQVVPGRKSVFQAVVYSLLLPGMGELYSGRFDRGIYPLVLEGLLWTGFTGFNLYGGWIKDDARSYATQHASIRGDGLDDQFYVNIGNYNSLDHFNSTKLVERDLASIYPSGTDGRYFWSWDTETSRLAYKDQRIHSDEMYNASKFVVLGLIANRVWSAIQSALIVKKQNASLTSALPVLKTEFISQLRPAEGMRLVLSQSF